MKWFIYYVIQYITELIMFLYIYITYYNKNWETTYIPKREDG